MQQYEGETNQIAIDSEKTPENNELGASSIDGEAMTESDES